MSATLAYASPPGVAAKAEAPVPDIALAPCLGWDAGCFRLGWNGGYCDRTLAVLTPRPIAIGTACSAARLATIRPQSRDLPLDMIVTEDDVAAKRKDLK